MGYEKVGLVDPESLSTRGTGIWGAKTRKYILLVHLERACLPYLLTPLDPLPCRELRDFWVSSRGTSTAVTAFEAEEECEQEMYTQLLFQAKDHRRWSSIAGLVEIRLHVCPGGWRKVFAGPRYLYRMKLLWPSAPQKCKDRQ